ALTYASGEGKRSVRVVRADRLWSICSVAAAFAVVLVSRAARAEFEIVNNHGYSLTSDGRVNIFLSLARGAAIPKNEQDYTGLKEEFTPDGNLASARMRTGFVMSVLGFNLTKQLAPGVNAKARVAMWMLASAQRNYSDEPAPTPRELYFKIEGPW